MERFTAILIETYKGAFPTWLAPQQVTVIPVSNDAHLDYAWEVAKTLRDRGIRAEVDERNEKMQYKIRQSQTQKFLISSLLVTRRWQTSLLTSAAMAASRPIPKLWMNLLKTS